MAFRGHLDQIRHHYGKAKSERFTAHSLAAFIRNDAKTAVEASAMAINMVLEVKGSAGQSRWAAVPWVGLFDPAVTTSAMRGYYLVYLFHATEPIVHLSLNQGATAVEEEFKSSSLDVLRERAELMRKRLPDFVSSMPITKIELGSSETLPLGYEGGHALGFTYGPGDLPSEEVLNADLKRAIEAYRALVFRTNESEDDTEVVAEFELPKDASVIETRKYVYHRKIERNATAAKNAKKFHGLVCQACDVDMEKRYGTIGRGYIEAHHLKPISTLEEGVAVRYDVREDFAVLCANCHRMIHRTSDPGDLNGFRKLIRET